jgi:expansin (peptidoglycan-binding protein)
MQVQGLTFGRLALAAALTAATALACACSSTDGERPIRKLDAPLVAYGPTYEGGEFHLGPVDWDETQFHNACAPAEGYPSVVRAEEGGDDALLAGLWGGIPDVAQYCDACIYVKTPRGDEAILRVVTYGDTTRNSIDVSPAAFDALYGDAESRRPMTWQLAKCPDRPKVLYQFQTGSNDDYTSLWVRQARVPITKVEVKSANHPAYVALVRGDDGTLTDAAGFGKGPFSLRVTALDGQELVDSFAYPSGGLAGALLEGRRNLQ